MDSLDLLSGDAQAFLEKVWASRVHVQHTAPDDLLRLLSLDDVDHLLTSSGLRTPSIRVAQDGSVLPTSRFTRSATLGGVSLSGLVDPRKVVDLFDGGATVVLQGLHRYWPPLTDLVRDLELRLGHPCQANAYLTPPGSQGFAVHSDTHDVFVFQTHGRKRWEIHEGGDVREVLMEPGTCMYLPTGTPHAARAEDVASLHVTVGIHPTTWRQVVDRSLRALIDELDLDDALPAGYHRTPGDFASRLGERLREVANRLDEAEPAALARAEVERFLTTRAPALRGGLQDRLALRSLTDDTALRRRSGAVCELVPDGERLRVLLGDRELRVPARLREPLELVRDQPELSPADLAEWLDERSRGVLVRRLVVEGLLEVTG